jgi:hypothetical protein
MGWTQTNLDIAVKGHEYNPTLGVLGSYVVQSTAHGLLDAVEPGHMRSSLAAFA